MITAYVDSGNLGAAWDFLKSMKRRGFQADGYTFGSILKGVARASRYDLGQKGHSLIVKIGYERNVYAGSALLDMYAECDRVEDAYDVFRGMPTRNFVSWNALLDGCASG
jgi:pentatricopeptide repeat protein